MAFDKFDKLLNPRNAVVFKYLFGSEKNEDILIGFLNDMISTFEENKVKKVTLIPPSTGFLAVPEKSSIVGVLCVTENEKEYVVELRFLDKMIPNFTYYLRDYAISAYVNHCERYEQIVGTIFLTIADFDLLPECEPYKSDYVITCRETGKQSLEDFSYTFLELSKFTLPKEQLRTMTDKWAYFFKHAHETKEAEEAELAEIVGEDKIIQRAYSALDRSTWSSSEREGLNEDDVIEHSP